MANLTLLSMVSLIGMCLGQISEYRYLHCELLISACTTSPECQSVGGQIDFRQQVFGGGVEVRLNVSGFDTNDGVVEHGVHIHDYGDYTDPCGDSHGDHWNPAGVFHGDLSQPLTDRHAGDLGNIREDRDGRVMTTLFIPDFPDFTGDFSITGRSLIIKANRDDLGLGGNENSLTTGQTSEGRSCCILGRSTGGNGIFFS